MHRILIRGGETMLLSSGCRHLTLGLVLPWASLANAADIPVVGLKLIVLDKLAVSSSAKTVFVTKDSGVTKGAGTNPEDIEATLDIAFDTSSGSFNMAQGANWIVNSPAVAKYVNQSAPTGGGVKVAIIKPGTLFKVVGKSLGDTPLDISTAPSGAVYVAGTIVNGGEETRLCTQFSACAHKVIAGGSGYKLVCKGTGAIDPACTAATPATTTSTSVTSSTTTTSSTTSTSLPPCGVTTGGFCWFLGASGADCDTTCAAQGRVYDTATNTYAGSGGSDGNCSAVGTALGGSSFMPLPFCGAGIGCWMNGGVILRCPSPLTTSFATGSGSRVCACM